MPHKHLVYAAFNFSYAYCFMGEIAFSVRYFSLPVCLKYSSADFINNLKTRPQARFLFKAILFDVVKTGLPFLYSMPCFLRNFDQNQAYGHTDYGAQRIVKQICKLEGSGF